MSTLFTLKNITLNFADKTLFQDTGVSMQFGEKVGLLGFNGQGKSSLLKIIAGELRPDDSSGFIFDKAVMKEGKEQHFSVFHIPQEVPLQAQEVCTVSDLFYYFNPQFKEWQKELDDINQQLNDSVQDSLLLRQKELLGLLEFHDLWGMQSAYESFLKYFNIVNFEQKISNMSGGEQKKALLSLGLASKAELLLWDEPTNHLDLVTIQLLEQELKGSRKSMIIVSHDRHFLNNLCDNIWRIHLGEIKTFKGAYFQFLEHLEQERAHQAKLINRLKNTLRRENAWMLQGIKARGTRSKKRVEQFENMQKNLGELKGQTRKQLEINISSNQKKSKQLVTLKDASFSHNESQLLNKLNLSVFKGDKIGLMGGNGSGKTTLVHLISGLLQPQIGKVKSLDDLVVNVFSQKRESLMPEMTPKQFLGEGSDQMSLPDGRVIHVNAYFEQFLFSKDQINRPLKTFSGGEKNRLQLAKNLTKGGDILIFDEPTNDLDIETIQVLEEKLSAYKGAIILISHDRAFLESVTNKVWLIHNREVEVFEAGYAHVESYLEAVQAVELARPNEQECVETQNQETPEVSHQKVTIKLTNKQKQRKKVLPQEIEACEQELAEVDQYLDNYKYSESNPDKLTELEKMGSKKQKLEELLLNLYTEQEEIEKLS